MAEPGTWLVALVLCLGVVTQSLVGFGLALIAMPLLVGMVGIRVAAPLVALAGLLSQAVLLARFRQALDLGAVRTLALGSVIGISVGVLALKRVDEALITPVLGGLIVTYALYGLSTPRVPRLEGEGWAMGFGILAGLLTGAYNIGGPPLVVYGNCRNWDPDAFRGNLQALILLHSTTVLAAHALSGNFTAMVGRLFLLSIPAIALGLVAGAMLEGRIGASAFRKLVLVVLAALGLKLIF